MGVMCNCACHRKILPTLNNVNACKMYLEKLLLVLVFGLHFLAPPLCKSYIGRNKMKKRTEYSHVPYQINNTTRITTNYINNTIETC